MKILFNAIIILLMSAICFTSCGNHRSLNKKQIRITTNTGHQRKNVSAISEQVNKTESDEITEVTEEVTTVYDTNLPIDSVTGKPPVLSETKKTTRKDKSQKKYEDASKSQVDSIIVLDNKQKDIQVDKDELKQKTETTVPRQIGKVIWALVALIGVSIIGWYIYRIKRN